MTNPNAANQPAAISLTDSIINGYMSDLAQTSHQLRILSAMLGVANGRLAEAGLEQVGVEPQPMQQPQSQSPPPPDGPAPSSPTLEGEVVPAPF